MPTSVPLRWRRRLPGVSAGVAAPRTAPDEHRLRRDPAAVSLIIAVTAVVLAGLLAVHRMPRDIFPDLGVPTIYVAQTYGGMDPAQMEGFIVNYYEYHFLYISGIEHVESKSIQGVGLVKLQFHPGADMSRAMAET